MENPTRGFKEKKLVLYSARIKIANKSKTVMSWISQRKLRAFFVLFILSKEIFFLTFVLSQCIVYRINFQNTHTFTYQNTLLYTHFCLFLKSLKAFSILNKTFLIPFQHIINILGFFSSNKFLICFQCTLFIVLEGSKFL